MEKTNHLSIRTDKALHDKIQYVAAYEGRCIREFEKEHGPIPPEDGK